MKKKLICILAVLLLVTSCGKVPKLKNGDEAVVTMKDGDISVEKLYSEMKEKYALDMLITKIDTAILNNVYKTDDEEKNYIDKQLETIKYYYETYYKSQYKSFQEYLTQNSVESEDELKENIRLTYKRNKAIKDYVKSIITDKEIEKYYDEKIFGDISASHILIKPEYDDNASDEEKKQAEKKALKEAKEVIAKLKKGEDFAELAKEYSDDSSNSKSGGKLADFNHGQMVEAFEDAAKDLKVGSYTTTPVKTEFGYHIILKTAQKDKPALKEVKDDIISDLTDEKLKDDSSLEVTALVELRKKHKVEIQDKDIKKLYEAYVEKNTK